ncbi:MAG: dihydrodipicolinate synthase family protein [Geminicoccaceae bacterium]|nr:dihydrodipicolinate synthase family protein [Geminicoccaceae bacterium]MDW8123770.1 dihydrodipicolinate synthase family protein [Geminicoccaceae bacterium]
MAGRPRFRPEGVIPACLLPFREDFSIDEAAFRAHLRDIASVRGISAITVNAHASEVASCSEAEQARVMEIALEEVGDRLPLVHGVYADGSHVAAAIARRARAQGASALLVFPSQVLAMGGRLRPEMALAHLATIAEASDLPIVLFQYPLQGPAGVGYTLETLVMLAERIPTLVAIKDWCADPVLHEAHIRTLQNLSRPVAVLSTHSAWLLSSLVLGCKGLLSGAGSVAAELQVEIFEAVRRDDLNRARAAYERYYPLARVFYAPPFLDMHNRMKEALVLLGRLPRAVVRPPLVKLPPAEIERIRAALVHAGMMPEARERREEAA